MTVTRLSLEFAFRIRNSNKETMSQGRELTRLKSPFGRLLHLFFVPECDFNLGYQSADEVANDLEPERKPATAFSRKVAEVEVRSIGERSGSCGQRDQGDLARLVGRRPRIPSSQGRTPIISTTTMSSDPNPNPNQLGPTPQDDADRVNESTTSFVKNIQKAWIDSAEAAGKTPEHREHEQPWFF